MTESFTLDEIYKKIDSSFKKTKIICTMGPKCTEHDILVSMLKKGMNIARLNFSHGDHESHGDTLQKVRAASKASGVPCAILLDTKGPEIRTGMLQDHKNINLSKDQTLEITTDYSFLGDSTKIACSYLELPHSVQVGSQILIADGSLVCEVLELKEKSVMVKVLNNCCLGERKNMNLPGCIVDLPTVTEKDAQDIQQFGLKHNVDMIALSFTRKGSDITQVRDLLGPKGNILILGSHIKIIAKIENQEGLNNFDDILDHTDGIMVARGDLGMEIPAYKVFVAQKWMIQKCNEKGKPVITATQMMESIISNPRPTRAEASDVANAVLDGTDVVMLSGETANGSYPVIAVETMAQICAEAEQCINYPQLFESLRRLAVKNCQKEALAISAVQLAYTINAPIIVTLTASGHGVRLMAKYRPRAQIYALCLDDKLLRSLSLVRGVTCYKVASFYVIDDLIDLTIKEGLQNGVVSKGQHIVIIYSKSEDTSNNIIRVQEVK